MDMSNFDVEHLQKMVYERSREWATFLEDIKKRETFDELPLTDFEDIIGSEFDEEDSNDDMASMEEKEGPKSDQLDLELYKTVSSAKQLALLLKNSTFSLAETTTKEEAELVDLVNQTMPIIQEHNRQLKETGFDRILCTFDKNKIEEKVGTWLNRHNSLFGGDSTLVTVYAKQEDSQNDNLSVRNKNKGRATNSKKPMSKGQEDSFDSDDSLQSGETARYIRSSRVGYFKKSTSCKTMIKTHRRLKSARDSLKEKYGFETDNDDYHLDAICYHKITNEYEYHPDHYNKTRKSRNKKHARHVAASSSKERRKVLRKRIATQCCNPDDLSDSDYYEDYVRHNICRNFSACCNTNHCSAVHNTCATVRAPSSAAKRSQCRANTMSLARPNRRYYYFQKLSKSLSSSSSSNSFTGACNKSLLEKKRKSNEVNTRQCKRMSECKCRSERKSCEKYMHVADTSTEDSCVDRNENEVTQIKNNYHKDHGKVKKPSKHVKSSANNTNEEATFFTASQIQMLCNSTAMSSHSPAYKRQIAGIVRQKQQKKDTKENIPNIRIKQEPEDNEKQKSSSNISSNSTVTSTSIRSSLACSSPKQSLEKKNATIVITDDEESDCFLVTSTTNHNLLDNPKGILIYAPNNPSSDPAPHSTANEGYFTITKEHLSSALGEKLAEKFLKYYIGRKRFNINSTVYYIPPTTKSLDNISSSSGSDDCLDNLGQYGDLYECL